MRARSALGYACACALTFILFATKAPSPASAPEAAPTALSGASPARNAAGEADGGTPCPDDMVYVDATFCPDISRRCVDLENERTNHLSICHAFASEQSCRSAESRMTFCIDRYEFPNQKGALPTRMLDWYQAQATCEAKQKRLCWASEWTAACEGPEHAPFPYGWRRDHDACNVDNFYIEPKRPGPKGQFFFYSKNPDVARAELSRLDQSVPSGSNEGCKSGFGVYDLTGNLDEWVVSDQPPREKSLWGGLKGGAWGHVRSQCRPMTTSHEPEFRYYFVGFRCCRNAGGPSARPWTPAPEAMAAPVVEPHDFAVELAERGWASTGTGPPNGRAKGKFSRTGRSKTE